MTGAPGLHITQWSVAGWTCLTCKGELVANTGHDAERLGEWLTATINASERVLLDLTEVSYIDSTGLHILLQANAQSQGRQGRPRLVVTDPAVRRLIEVTGAGDLLEVFSSLDAARSAG